jgi:hypothetical protein
MERSTIHPQRGGLELVLSAQAANSFSGSGKTDFGKPTELALDHDNTRTLTASSHNE